MRTGPLPSRARVGDLAARVTRQRGLYELIVAASVPVVRLAESAAAVERSILLAAVAEGLVLDPAAASSFAPANFTTWNGVH